MPAGGSLKKNFIGQIFGHLTVIGEAPKRIQNTSAYWKCQCICGKIIEVPSGHLNSGHTKSCGCLKGKNPSNKGKYKDLTGKQIGNLTVLDLNLEKSTNKQKYWNCQCKCEKFLVVSSGRLRDGKTSCGCDIKKEIKPVKIKNDLTGIVFDRLTVISRAEDKIFSFGRRATWNCLCICGNTLIVSTVGLITKNTRSCGCFHKESSRKNIKKSHLIQTKYKDDPSMCSASEVWRWTYKEDNGISFEDFLIISQQNCYYCGIEPKQTNNYYVRANKYGVCNYLSNIDDGIFVYNGLDRINSKENHNINNVIPCCKLCNRTKNNQSINEFKNHIYRFVKNELIEFDEHRVLSNNINMDKLENLPSSYKVSAKCTYSDNYKDGDLSFEQFYRLSQLNCYYCGISPINKFNKYKQKDCYFEYNGLDRINSDLTHTYSNVVNCCKFCNFGKGKLSFESFANWINRLKNNFINFEQSYNNLIQEKYDRI